MANLLPAEFPEIVSLDALGTLIEIIDPVGGLVAALAQRGFEVTGDEAAAGIGAEMAYYRANIHSAADRAGLDGLRDRCTEVLGAALPQSVAAIDFGELRDSLVEAVRFAVFPEVHDALDVLRGQGCKLVVVSNWDISLYEVLEQTGLAERVDAVVTSAEEGLVKPDPELIWRAVERAGGDRATSVWHVGDDPVTDVRSAQAAGVLPVLIDRYDQYSDLDELIVLESLSGLTATAR